MRRPHTLTVFGRLRSQPRPWAHKAGQDLHSIGSHTAEDPTILSTPNHALSAEPKAEIVKRRRASTSMLGIALMALLLPLRGIWAADLVLVILAFTVPGVLTLRALRLPGPAIAGQPIYIPAASIVVMLIAGLATDLVGPPLGLARPLEGSATAFATIVLCLLLWLVGLRRPEAPTASWRHVLGRPQLLAPLALPVVSAGGALLLTNGQGSTVARVAAILSVALLFYSLMSANRLDRSQVAMLLFACALATEWAFSLRSQEVIGFDITTEFQVAQHTQTTGIWHTLHHGDAYGAMLSITILPSVLRGLTGASLLTTFKVLYPVLTALVPMCVFLVGDRFMRRGFAAGAAALLLIQSYFFQLLPELARQEVGLLFFTAMAVCLVDDRLKRGARLRLVPILAGGLVVSHYSSTYMAFPIVLVALIVSLLSLRRGRVLLTPMLCSMVVLISGAAIWYGAVTDSSSNLAGFTSDLEHKGLSLLPNRTGNIITSYLQGNTTHLVSGARFEQAAVGNYRNRSAYIHPLPQATLPRFQLRSAKVPTTKVRSRALADGLQAFATIFGQVMLILAVLGTVTLAFRRVSSPLSRQLGALGIGTLTILALIRFSGTIASFYNQTRALLQALILLALPAAWLTERLCVRISLRRIPAPALLAGALTLFFAYATGATTLVFGGGTSFNLSQSGEDFERQYMTPAELAGAKWASQTSRDRLLYADEYGQLRLNAASGNTALNLVTPRTLDRRAWLYGTRSNVVLHRGRGSVENVWSVYEWPSQFLTSFFDTVYANRDSEVYHR